MNRTNCHCFRRPSASRGFTLVELLAVMVIIGILAGALIPAVSAARQTAMIARTQQLITKLNTQLMRRWEAYQTMRLPITIPQVSATQGIAARQQAAIWKLNALRELMRMELPDHYADLQFQPQYLINTINTGGNSSSNQSQPVTPDLKRTYLNYISNTTKQSVSQISQKNQSAECLYMIITLGAIDQDLFAVSFSPSDVGDTDNDGMPEFIDAWGNAVQFIRWPAGFVSDLQPQYSVPSSSPQLPRGLPPDPNNQDNVLTRFPIQVDTVNTPLRYLNNITVVNNHDCFDPTEVDPGPNYRQIIPERGYNLFPLIVSAGPNFDAFGTSLGFGLTFPTSANSNDPYAVAQSATAGGSVMAGSIIDPSAYDNVHNHLIGTKK